MEMNVPKRSKELRKPKQIPEGMTYRDGSLFLPRLGVVGFGLCKWTVCQFIIVRRERVIYLAVLDQDLFHQVHIDLRPTRVISIQHLQAPSREEREMIDQHSTPLVLFRDLDQVATVLEEIVGHRDRLTVG